jgi:hypothetical protein
VPSSSAIPRRPCGERRNRSGRSATAASTATIWSAAGQRGTGRRIRRVAGAANNSEIPGVCSCNFSLQILGSHFESAQMERDRDPSVDPSAFPTLDPGRSTRDRGTRRRPRFLLLWVIQSVDKSKSSWKPKSALSICDTASVLLGTWTQMSIAQISDMGETDACIDRRQEK